MFFTRAVATGFLLLGTVLPAPTFAAETVTVGGVGSLTPVLKRLAEDYKKREPTVDVVVINPPLGSAGGLRALAAGKVDIALSGRPLKPGEAGAGKAWIETPLVLATNGGKNKGLTPQEVADMYAARKTSWGDGASVRLVLRGEHESETAALRSMSPDVDVAVAAALKRPGLPVAENDLEAVDMLGRVTGSLGTTTLGLIKSEGVRLQPIAIAGVIPNVKNMESGAYRWKRTYHLVVGVAPKPAATAFLNYLNSAAAIKRARELEYLPAK